MKPNKYQYNLPNRGELIGTIAYYGPDDKTATKLVVGIMREGNHEVEAMKKWYADSEIDLRQRRDINSQVMAFMAMHGVRNVVKIDRIFGCPHEEGIDYSEGESCPKCPFWKNRER